ncbi:pneumococcal serine-rich repeat protein-like isoform X5 [Anastrepha ludens]|uniref:pneumococcal serine-rich repeat protein-like isoform X5 n=1 Tax=Anastrepha ludens TaxID=28586 RepID=UPI0023B0D995|nr:pneumococcal serine-rich repeat protein-like isoform X5 [Anastrepha ludens]
MLAIKECLIREGVLNLTSTANHSNSTSLTSKQGNGAADGDGDDGGDGGIENTAVGGSGAGANNTATYRNRNYNDSVVGNNLRAISTNYTRNSDNRNNRNYDMASSLALDFQSVRLTDQISVDAARSQNTDTNNENKSSNCSLSSASATANSSCQQTSIYDKSKHLQQQKQQRVPATGSKSSTRYQGVHPHFHHHTAPSYYTDVNLHIHTPKANDVAALNENYQSVYNTPSQLVNERHFPKTSTATVVPPPIGTGTAAIGRANTTSPTSIAKRDRESVSANSSSNIKSSSSSSARAAFFRGGSVGSNSNGERKSCEHFTKSSPAFGRPTKKGEFNDTSYTPYDISGSSFVVGTLSSSDCSKTNQLDNTTDTHINTNHNNKHNSNNNISLTSPTSAGHTSASASATASASASASASGRSRNSNRFAGKKRAVRVRSESRPISALYDIICKEKGLDIGTSSSSSTTNEEEHSASASNDDENRGAHSKRSTNSKERCRQRSGSRNSNRNNSTDYSEISHRLPAFVAKSLSNHSGEFVGQSNMDNVATVNSAAVDTKAAHDRSKRSHKSRTPSSQKSASKKRKDVGKTKVSVMRCAMSDDEPNNETSEDSNELRARAVLSPLTKYHTEFSHKMNSTEKASSLPPRLQSATRTSSSSVKQALQPHKASCHANTDLSTYPIVKKCPVHSRCDLVDCDYQLSSVHRPSHYTHAHHQSSLPPNLSSGPCSSIRSPSTADDDSLMVVNSLGYSPDKLFFEPVNMTLSSVSSGAVSGKNVNSSSSGVVFDQTSARSNQRIGRAQHRRLREEMRRHTDLPLLDMLSPNSLSSQLSTTERALSEDEGVAGVKQQKSRTSKARRFINRPSHTPTHGRSGNSANGSPHPIRRNSNKQTSESSSSASSPAPTNRRNSSANGINSINRPTVVPPINTVAAVAGVTIEDVGSASSGDHLTHIKLSPLQIMTNSATPATELPPRANGSAALGEGEAHPAEADMHDEAHEDTGNGSIGVQTIISDDSLAARRRRRRELGMVRQLVPSDDLILREMLLPHQKKSDSAAKKTPIGKSSENELAYHMEMARRGWDLTNPSINNRARSETATSKYESNSGETVKEKPSNARLARRSDTLHLGELRKLRSNDVNRKMNERTKSDLAEIKKIAEQANIEMAMMTSGIVTELAELVVSSVDCEQEAVVELATPARYGIGSRSQASPPPTPSFTELEMAAEAKERDPSPAKHATFMQEERFYYDPETSDQISKSVSNNTMASGILRQRILKARSIERDAAHEPPKLSPILRRKSTDDPPCITAPPTSAAGIYSTSQNHIVSILKKKDHIAGESSSASSNASPVTFSANVVDTPTTKQKRAGILKKRSSLDESRYYSRSHSPDERSILIKSARRNSLEETAGLQQQQQQQQHGILKQSSYESSKSDGCPSATEPHPHSILKKKDSTSTPSDGGTHAPKHVSISQAVKMAAAELCRQTADGQCATTEHEESGYTPNNEEYEIRPILKLESASSDDVMRPPKPILKKKSSGDSDEYEIRPILKTSRKSSREEFDLSGSLSEDGRHYSEPPPPPPVRPILKTDSPSKRRSLGIDELEQDASSAEYVSNSPSLLKRRTRSLERQEPPVVDLAAALNAIATSQAAPLDFVSTPITTGGNISVAERIKNMEKFLSSNGASPSTPADVNSSWDSPLLHTDITPRLLKPSVIRRDMYRDRYKTQPVTNDEKMLFKATASPLDISVTSAFKPTKSLDAGLNYTAFAHSNAASNASLGSSYTLTRCSTQSLHGQNHFDAAGTSSVGSPPLRAVIGRLNSLSDRYNNSGSEQLTHWVGSDSERIFEMSGIEENAAAAAASTLNDKSEVGVGVGGTGLARKNSVRARANMFQQLQEKTKSEEAATAESSASTATTFNREEQTSPRRAPRQLSPTPTMFATPPILSSSMASAANASCSEEHKTPQVPTRTEEEIEPTSLPVSERLRFFANLTEAANRSLSSSYTRSPSQRHLTADRCGSANSYNHIHSITNTPRSSYNGGGSTTTSSASVTPTPMDCYSPPLSEPQLISINEIDSALQMEHNFDETAPSPLPSEPVPNATTHETSAFIKLSKSSSHTSLSSVVAQRLALSVPAPVVGPSALTPVARRIKMKTIGKLHLPQTFLNNDHNSSQSSSNNNHNISNNSIGNVYSDTCDSECSSIEAVSKPPAAPLKKIGKIKSPFIENCLQMEQKHHQLNSKYMKYDHKSTPHNALAALENNVANSGGGERDMNSLPQRKPLQNGNASLPPQRVDSNEDSNTDSGKENNYGGIKTVPLLTISPTASLIALTEQSHSPVVEMRKKFTRIMNGSSLSTVSQRLSAHAYHTDNGSVNGKGNGNGNNSGVSSAPTTPRNSMIDEKYAKYFGLTSNNSHSQNCATTTTNKTSTCKESSERARTQHSANNARLQFAGEKTAGPRHAPNYPPPPPPPLDFYHTTNGETHCPSKAKDELIVAMETNSGYDVHLTPFEAINHNVRSNSNTPYYTPPTTMPLPMTGNTLTAYNTAVHTTPSGIANVPQRRRDIAKRQRANTTNVTFTPTSSQVPSPHANFGTPSAGRARTLRTRALTLTHGMPLPEVKRFEDIVVTKEDFQLASKEFERIFLGII